MERLLQLITCWNKAICYLLSAITSKFHRYCCCYIVYRGMSWLLEEQKDCSLQGFREVFEARVITEWLEAYIHYESLSQYFHFLHENYQHYHHQVFKKQRITIQIMPLEPEVREQIENAISYINSVAKSGEEKVRKFVRWKLSEILYYWQEALTITIDYEMQQNSTHQAFHKKFYIKELLKIIYTQALCLKEYIFLNKKIKNHAEQVIRCYGTPLIIQKAPEVLLLNQSESRAFGASLESVQKDFENGKIERLLSLHEESDGREYEEWMKQLTKVEKGVRELFHSPIYLSEGAESDLHDYTKITKKQVSVKNYFLFGLYIGLGMVIFLSLILLLILDIVEFQKDDSQIGSMTYMFPMFRGVGLLILYLWGMSWNVYGFIKYKINFKLILEYGSHYSNPYQIMKRAGFFTLIFCLMLFLYLVGLEASKNRPTSLPIEYTPFVVWTIYFTYIFFPSKLVFNPKGRTYFYAILKKIFKSPCVKMSFLLSFATDQAVSFVTSIKDFAYTVCFYGSDFSVREVSNCLRAGSLDGIIIGYVAAILPLLFRMIQCFNQARQASGKFIGHIQMWNFFKYLSSVCTSTFSFLSSLSPIFFVPFVVSSVVSTSYSYFWDLKYDWGLLQKGSKRWLLRNNLCYKNPGIYYAAILMNLLFRCSWTLTISPSVTILIPKSTFLPFVTGFIEIFRRCMWNFFRIEKQHVANCSSYSVVKEKPSSIVYKIKSQGLSSSFGGKGRESVVEYTKVADVSYSEQLKQSMDLPSIDSQQIEKAQMEFENYLSLANEQEQVRANRLSGQILSAAKKDYYDL